MTSAGLCQTEVQCCNNLTEKAVVSIESVIQMYPDDIDVVLSSNGDVVMSVVPIIKDDPLSMDITCLGYNIGHKAVKAAVNVPKH